MPAIVPYRDRANHQFTLVVLISQHIYGPNAAGKTNIIGALEFIPNNRLKAPIPVEFSVEFYEDEML